MLHIRAIVPLLGLVACIVPGACAQPVATRPPAPASENTMHDTDKGRAGLPFAGDRVFYSLDDYLAFRRELGKTDRATWYDEVSPGVYRYVARAVPPEQRRTWTRAELMAEFGFSE